MWFRLFPSQFQSTGMICKNDAGMPIGGLVERLSQGVVLCAEGYLFELERRGLLEAGPFVLTRYEMADFAVRAQKENINFIGICCGGAPHHVRAMAEALGRTVEASKYSPDLSLHPVLGKDGVYCPG